MVLTCFYKCLYILQYIIYLINTQLFKYLRKVIITHYWYFWSYSKCVKWIICTVCMIKSSLKWILIIWVPFPNIILKTLVEGKWYVWPTPRFPPPPPVFENPQISLPYTKIGTMQVSNRLSLVSIGSAKFLGQGEYSHRFVSITFSSRDTSTYSWSNFSPKCII